MNRDASTASPSLTTTAGEVFNGSRMGKEFSANVFNDYFRWLDGIPENDRNGHTAVELWQHHRHKAGPESALEQAAGILSLETNQRDYEGGGFRTPYEKEEESQTQIARHLNGRQFSKPFIPIPMQQEDDLRALAKIMEFGRAVSIFLLVVHVYVYCYPSITAWNLNLEVTDRILVNFNNTTGIFNCILWTKLLAVTLLAISCLGTHGVKGEKITWPKIYAALVAGCVLFFLNWWLLDLSLPHMTSTILYVITLTAGYLGLLMAGLWMSRLYRHNLMGDVFNIENESFQQETRLLENEYSVNLPTSFRFQGKQHDGWINVVNPFRATIVLGTPGSGKSYAVVNNYIRQMISKGYSCYIYDYKFDDLSTIAYNTLLNNMDKYKVKPRFYVINFDDPRRSHRCNPINPEFMTDISDAYEGELHDNAQPQSHLD